MPIRCLFALLLATVAGRDMPSARSLIPWWKANGKEHCQTFEFVIEADGEAGTAAHTFSKEVCVGNFAEDVAKDHDPRNADRTCLAWCSKEECKDLRGNLTQECGLCGVTALCRPASPDFSKHQERNQELHAAALAAAKVEL